MRFRECPSHTPSTTADTEFGPQIQSFDFGFEEEDSIEGMKRLIVEEVHTFRAEVRAQARAAGQIRRQERFVVGSVAGGRCI